MKKIDELKKLLEGKVKSFDFPQNAKKEKYAVMIGSSKGDIADSSGRIENICTKVFKKYNIDVDEFYLEEDETGIVANVKVPPTVEKKLNSILGEIRKAAKEKNFDLTLSYAGIGD